MPVENVRMATCSKPCSPAALLVVRGAGEFGQRQDVLVGRHAAIEVVADREQRRHGSVDLGAAGRRNRDAGQYFQQRRTLVARGHQADDAALCDIEGDVAQDVSTDGMGDLGVVSGGRRQAGQAHERSPCLARAIDSVSYRGPT
jgi:hypothetical protein